LRPAVATAKPSIATAPMAEAMPQQTAALMLMPMRSIIEAAFAETSRDVEGLGDVGPESTWLPFKDPLVFRDIRDVLKLLDERLEPESPDPLRNRLRLHPDAADMPVASDGANAAAVTEAIVRSDDLEDIQMLVVGYRAAKAVGLVALNTGFGGTVPRGT